MTTTMIILAIAYAVSAIVAIFTTAVLLFTYRVATWRIFDETGDWL